MKYYIFHHASTPKLIRGEDLPEKFSMVSRHAREGQPKCFCAACEDYRTALATALEEKGIRIVNAEAGENAIIILRGIAAIEVLDAMPNTLYPLPDSWEVKIEKKKNAAYDGTVMEPLSIEVATLSPVKEETKDREPGGNV